MAVRHEIKSQLAKLLATEDLIVEHKQVKTAQFNVHTRVLILPQWDLASNGVYDMLVGHEVGHALFTPDRWEWEGSIPQNFVNVVEDARVERLMKRKYAGLAKTFYNGYNELHDRDFFETYGEDISTFNLADRANLYFKVGNWLPVVFSSAEKQIISLIESCETFDDTLDAARTLYEYCKAELEKQNKESEEQNGVQSEMDFGGGEEGGEGEEELSESSEGGELQPAQQPGDDKDPAHLDVPSFKEGGCDNDPLDIQTADKLERALKELASAAEGRESSYFELPNLNVDEIIIDNDLIHKNCVRYWEEEKNDYEEIGVSRFHCEEIDDKFREFKKSAQKEVNYLVKEFECKKAADSYARATTARTGVLDCSKLHTYRYNEDLFKKVTTLADGKNHGLVFVLDWSGSMAEVMLDTIKQLYNLMWFCKKVNIPFEVYAFTNDYPRDNMGHQRCYEKNAGIALIEETFSMMNLFTSKVKTKVMEEQMKNIFRITSGFYNRYSTAYGCPTGMRLSGTPLNEAIVSLHNILPQFKEENQVQKVQCVILTDGEGQPLRYSKEVQRRPDSLPWLGSGYIGHDCVMRDRKTGRTYSFSSSTYWADISDTLLENLKHNFPDMNLIGIRVLASRDAGQFIRRYTGYEGDGYNKIMKRWKRERSFAILNSGYDTYFGLSANTLSNDDEFEVREDATKAQIRSAFKKSLKSKKMNKKVLGEFIELVA